MAYVTSHRTHNPRSTDLADVVVVTDMHEHRALQRHRYRYRYRYHMPNSTATYHSTRVHTSSSPTSSCVVPHRDISGLGFGPSSGLIVDIDIDIDVDVGVDVGVRIGVGLG